MDENIIFKSNSSIKEIIEQLGSITDLHNKPICFMLIGPPASGKSTIASEICKHIPDMIKKDLDSIILNCAKKENLKYQHVISDDTLSVKCNAEFNIDIQETIYARKSFIWEQLNTVSSSRQKKILRIKGVSNKNISGINPKEAYTLIGIYTDIPLEIISKRLDNRNKENKETENDKFISCKTLDNIFNNYVIPSKDEFFDYLFSFNENLILNFMPSTPYVRNIKSYSNKPSAEEIEERRKLKIKFR